MRIAFLVGKFPSISETFILNQVTGLLDAGHDVDIFAFEGSDDDKAHEDVTAYRLLDRTHYIAIPKQKRERLVKAVRIFLKNVRVSPREVLQSLNVARYGRKASSLSLLLTAHLFLEHGPYDILNCHFGRQGMWGMRLKQMGIPGKLVVTFHGHDVSQLVEQYGPHVYRRLFKHADLLLPVSEYWQRKLVSMGADPHRIAVHHMGIQPEHFPYQERVPEAGQPTRMITVGRLVEKKGIEYGIRAVAEVLRRQPALNIRYRIIGGGPLREQLEALAQALRLEEIVQFLGSKTQEAVREEMLASHVFLLPSITSPDGDQEGIPVSLMEAMAAGLPVLSTFHSGIPELVQDGVSGCLAEEKDVSGLAAHLEWMIENPQERAQLSRAGREMVEQEFNIRRQNMRLAAAFQQLLDPDKTRSGKPAQPALRLEKKEP